MSMVWGLAIFAAMCALIVWTLIRVGGKARHRDELEDELRDRDEASRVRRDVGVDDRDPRERLRDDWQR